MTINLNDFSVEILLQIFQFCDIKELCYLKRSCKRFNSIINTYKIATNEQHTLATNQIQIAMKNRCFTTLNPFEKWRFSYNWKIGRYKIIKLLKQRKKLMPWLSLDKQYLWVSHENSVKAFKRKMPNAINEIPAFVFNNETAEDIVRFRIKKNYVISGLREGGIWIWSLEDNKFIFNQSECHVGDISDIDLTQNIFVSGSSDRTYSIWPIILENDAILTPLCTNLINDKIWSIGISPCNRNLAVGTAGFGVPPFHVFDLESNVPIFNLNNQRYRHGAGVLDIHWENENTIMTCGYDTYLKKWDLRTGKQVQKWEDPHDSALYCLASDDLYTILTGTISYGRVVLWDQRVPQRYIQLYFTCNSSSLYKSSPVYSLGFDSSQLFAALDQNVTCLDFSNSYGKVRNYDAKYYKSCFTGSIV